MPNMVKKLSAKETSLLAEFEDLKLEERKIKVRLEEIKPILLDMVPDEGYDLKYGSLKIRPYTVWHYSDIVTDLEAELEVRKEIEKAEGMATAVAKPTLRYDEF